jgi:hypothetical protein
LKKVEDHLHLANKSSKLYEILAALHLYIISASQKDGPFEDKCVKQFCDSMSALVPAVDTLKLFDSNNNDNVPSVDQIPNYMLLFRVLKTMDDIRKLYKENTNSHKNRTYAYSQLATSYGDLIKKGLAWDGELKQRNTAIKGTRFHSYLPFYVEVLCTVAPLQLENASKAIQQALEIARKYRSEEAMKLVING